MKKVLIKNITINLIVYTAIYLIKTFIIWEKRIAWEEIKTALKIKGYKKLK